MFLKSCLQNNSKLIEFAFHAHQQGLILPDTYLLDLDTIVENGRKMLETARQNEVKLFFMLKQLGRNPVIAKRLEALGFDGCVAVDYKEALLMIEHGVHLGNVGHLVQTPKAAMKKIVAARPDVMTVYSLEKIAEINQAAAELNVIQPLMLRITDADASLYSGQVAGFFSDELPEILHYLKTLKHVCLGGITVFPALLYNEETKQIQATSNVNGLLRALQRIQAESSQPLLINIPSATCCASIPLIRQLGGNNGEPGHGLTGTTPLHKAEPQPENIGYVYVSEISHNYKDKAYCYGGGHYRRGHMEHVLVGSDPTQAKLLPIAAPDDDSIDYHFEIDGRCTVSETALMCFRAQIFTTRSQVAIVEGLHQGTPRISGLYDAMGKEIKVNWE